MRLQAKHIFWLKLLIHISALTPFIFTFYQAMTDQLGGDPVKALIHFTGISAFNLLLLSLLISPMAKKFKQGQLINLRRVLGLYSFFYAFAHFLCFILFELQMEWLLLLSEIVKRPYITVGFIAWLLLLAMSFTSTKGWQKRLGKSWQALHNWVYLALALVALHYIWSVKSVTPQPLVYIALSLLLLSFRKPKLKRWLNIRKS